MLNKKFIYSIFIVLCLSFSEAIIINEIMYDPSVCSDADLEWLELYNPDNENINLSSWKINTSTNSYEFEETMIENNSYLVIAKKLVNDNSSDCSFESVYGNNDGVWNDSDNFTVIEEDIVLSNTGLRGLILYNKTDDIIDNITYNGSQGKSGYSFERFNGSFYKSVNPGGSPGRLNDFVLNETVVENNTQSLDCSIPSINITLNETNMSINQLLVIGWNATDLCTNNSYNLTIKIARHTNNNSDWEYVWFLLNETEIFADENGTDHWDIINFTIPDDGITGDYKVRATLEYHKNTTDTSSRYKEIFFFINGVSDLGEEEFFIVQKPESISFGEAKMFLVRFNANNYNKKELTLVNYIYSPSWVAVDLNGNILRTRPYETNAAFTVKVLRGENITFGIPIFIKKNCDNDYGYGDYKGRIRAYYKDEEIAEANYNISITSSNDENCETSASGSTGSKSSASICPTPAEIKTGDDKAFNYDKIGFKIGFPVEISADEMVVNISAQNTDESEKEFSSYAYIFYKTKALGDKKDNEKKIVLKKGEKKDYQLLVKINSSEIEEKEYKIMIKFNSSGLKSEKSVSYPIIFAKNKGNNKIVYENNIISCKNKNDNRLIIETLNEKAEYDCYDNISVNAYEVSPCFAYIIDKDDVLGFQRIEDNKSIKNKKENLKLLSDNDELLAPNISSKKENQITGKTINIIFESTSEKLKRLINALLLLTFITLIILLLKKDRGEK